jgi:putative ABC transport system permease protein
MVAFGFVTAFTCGVLAGGASAWHALRPDTFPLLKDGGSTATAGRVGSRSRDALIVAQIAIGLLLAVGAGLLVRSLQRFSQVPVGFEPKSLSAMIVYPREKASKEFAQDLLAAARAIPGVKRAALVGYLPLDLDRSRDDTAIIAGRLAPPTDPDLASVNWFSPGYLQTAGMRLEKGRDLNSADASAAVVNETFVNRYLAGRDPIGVSFSMVDWPGATFAVGGVVADVRQWGPAYPPLPEVYLPQAVFARNQEAANDGAVLLLQSSLPQGVLDAALRKTAAQFDGRFLFGPLRPLDDYLAGHLRQRKLQLGLALTFATVALGLAALGVYGTMAYSVVQRRRELGVRAALGARGEQLARLVVVRAARLAAGGLIAGLAGAFAFTRFLSALLYGVGARDPLTFVVAAGALLTVALAAALLPAVAAARTDPMTALRSE